MSIASPTSVSRMRELVVVLCVVAIAGCAAPETKPAAAPAPAPALAPPVAAAEPPRPVAPAVPELSPAQARAEAQKLAIQAVDQLQSGDESAARGTVEQALALDAGNDLARKLRDQIGADAEKELGTVSFRYTVQRDDSLSKLAQQYLGDRFRFWILARYNDIPNPSRLAAGQVIRIPGRAPTPAVAAAAPRPTTPRVEEPPPPPPAPVEQPAPAPAISELSTLMQRAVQLQKAGNLEASYTTYGDVLQRAPANKGAAEQREGVRKQLVARYEREATQAFQRQNLDLSITRWNRVIELEPNHPRARLERDRAADLKKRLAERFGETK